MIVLLGSTGYLGRAFETALQRRGQDFVALSRAEVDYTKFDLLMAWLRSSRPSFVINAAGYTGKPNVDACEEARADTLQGNVVFPAMLAYACALLEIPWAHLSSGCIFRGAYVHDGTDWRLEPDLARPDLRALAETCPERIRGFSESDPPNFTFRDGPCSFYSGSKALAEEALAGVGQGYIWRVRIPFDEFDHGRNFLSKLQRYAKVYDNVNSLSHRGDLAHACLDLWQLGAPFGTYHVTNPGFVTAAQVVERVRATLAPGRRFEFWQNDDEFYASAAVAQRSNCVLDVSRLQQVGVSIRPLAEALEDSLRRWVPET